MCIDQKTEAGNLYVQINIRIFSCQKRIGARPIAIYIGFRERYIMSLIRYRVAGIKSLRQPDGRMGLQFNGIPVYNVVAENHLEVC